MKIHLIYNPNSGGGKGNKLYPLIHKQLSDAGHTVIPYRTLYRFHATELAKHIDNNNCDLILAAGGDGTAHEVLNGIMQNTSSDNHPLFALIPVGTGNSFSQDLNFKHWRDGLQAIEKGKIVDVDLLKIVCDEEAHYSMNCTGFGFVADVNVLGNKMKKFIGKTAYTVGALIEILRFKPHKCKIEVDGVVHEYNGVLTNFSNSVWIGGNMKISPNSVIDDGIAECLILKDLPKRKLMKVFPKVFDGSHLSVEEFEIFTGKHFRAWSEPSKITNPDGEMYGATPLDITVLPKEIKMLSL